MKYLLAATLGIVMTCTAAIAGGGAMQPGWIPRDASLVVHVDIARIMTHMDQSAWRELVRDARSDDNRIWEEIKRRLAIEPGADVRAFTMAKVGPLPQDLLFLFRTSSRLDGLPELIEELVPEYRRTEMNDIVVHSWTELVETDRQYFYGHRIPLDDDDDRLWLVAMNWEHLLDGVNVVRGTAPHLELDEDPQNTPQFHDDAFVLAYLADPKALKELKEGGSDIKELRWAAFQMSGGRDAYQVDLTLGLTDENHAEDFATVATGMLGMARVFLRDQEDLLPLVNLAGKVRVSTDQTVLRATLRCSAEDLRAAGEAMRHKMREVRKEMRDISRDSESRTVR